MEDDQNIVLLLLACALTIHFDTNRLTHTHERSREKGEIDNYNNKPMAAVSSARMIANNWPAVAIGNKLSNTCYIF